jgi:UDP:flavonoid glycosyltransferase YjiC (YdhE family)
MSIFAFVMLPEIGHIVPTLRVARKLRAAGHGTCHVITPDFEALLQSHGFPYQIARTSLLNARTSADVLSLDAGVNLYARLHEHLADQNVSVPEMILDELNHCTFDVASIDFVLASYHGAYFAQKIRQPVIALSVCIPEIPPIGLPEIILCPREFDFADMPWSLGNRLFCEPSLFDSMPVEFPWQTISPGKPLAYASFGTQANRYANLDSVMDALLGAFARLPGWQFILVCGPMFDALRQRKISSNVVLVRSAPQRAVLDKADLFITHGGLGGIKEAIMSGTPMLVIPFDQDQPANGERVQSHHLGRCCSPCDCTAERIEALLKEVSDPAVRANVTSMRNVFLQVETETPSVRYMDRIARDGLSTSGSR